MNKILKLRITASDHDHENDPNKSIVLLRTPEDVDRTVKLLKDCGYRKINISLNIGKI